MRHMSGRCANCELPAHRYSTQDPEHAPDKTACINGLHHVIGELRQAMLQALGDLEQHYIREAQTLLLEALKPPQVFKGVAATIETGVTQ